LILIYDLPPGVRFYSIQRHYAVGPYRVGLMKEIKLPNGKLGEIYGQGFSKDLTEAAALALADIDLSLRRRAFIERGEAIDPSLSAVKISL